MLVVLGGAQTVLHGRQTSGFWFSFQVRREMGRVLTLRTWVSFSILSDRSFSCGDIILPFPLEDRQVDGVGPWRSHLNQNDPGYPGRSPTLSSHSFVLRKGLTCCPSLLTLSSLGFTTVHAMLKDTTGVPWVCEDNCFCSCVRSGLGTATSIQVTVATIYPLGLFYGRLQMD